MGMTKMLSGSVRQARETDPTLLRLKLIGQMEARTLTGESVLPVGGKTRALLAILALSDRKPVLRSRLAELLWSRRPEDMARASLRQEIHRLLDALSPVGVELIDVQRHSLTLKPALTSVDAERILTATVRTIDGIPAPEEILLGELSGIDPALDEWLDQQRARLSHHLLAIYEGCLRELTDADQVDDVTDRLLKVDPLNEAAWRAKIQNALRRGEHARATMLAEQATRVLGQQEGLTPSPLTQGVLASVLKIPGSEGGGAISDAAGSEVISAQFSGVDENFPLAVSGQRTDPMLALPLHLARMAAGQSRKISLLILTPFTADGHKDIELKCATSLGDQFELLFVHVDTFDIVAMPEGFVPDPVNPMASYRGLGADYIITGAVRAGASDHALRLILKVMDVRAGGVIVWGTHYDLPEMDPMSVASGLIGPASAMQWGLLLAEARRIANRADGELSALGKAARVFMLLLKGSNEVFPHVSQLLEVAGNEDPREGNIALMQVLYCLIRYENDWSDEGTKLLTTGVQFARQLVNLKPDASGGAVLLATLLMHDRASLPMARSIIHMLAKTLGGLKSGNDLPDYMLCHLLLRLFDEDLKGAAELAGQLRNNPYHSPLYILIRPFFMMVMMLGGERRDVIEMGRLMAGLYPNYPSALVYYLVALVEERESEEEIQHVRDHLHRLVPDLTIAKILSRFPYLSEAKKTELHQAFLGAGLS
ncbi:Bacterial transcriptional activator domain protein [Gluconobacter japonicus]|nr:Bacterial transcriptional activator domain protein [Gluconobacter japonicus]